MRKTATARFCSDCGYELAQDSSGECPMCARFEQMRIEFSVPRPSELGARHTRPEGRVDVNHPVASADGRLAASEYRAILAANRARAASADGGSGGPAATVFRTPGLGQPAKARMEAPSTVLAAESSAPPEAVLAAESPAPAKKPGVRRKNRRPTDAPTAPLAGESPAPAKKPGVRRKNHRPTDAPTAPLAGELPAPPEKSTARRNRPTPTLAPSGGPTPILIRLRAPQQPANATMEAPTTAWAGESPAPPEKSTSWRSRPTPTPPPTRESARSLSAAAEHSTLPPPDADRVIGARAARHHSASPRGRVMLQIAIGVVIGGTSALISASVALFAPSIF
jgi:hypothetical protein